MKIKILAAGIALTLPFWACAKDVTIIYTNDLHAHVEPYKVPWIADGKRDIGGWANITTLVKQEKAKNKATWFFDAGDYFTGPYISSLTKGKAIIDIMNTMPFDAVTIGNHEFDHGWDNTLLQLSQAKFPIVQGNVFYQNSSKSFWDKPYTIIEKDGVKIGVIVCTVYLPLMTRYLRQREWVLRRVMKLNGYNVISMNLKARLI